MVEVERVSEREGSSHGAGAECVEELRIDDWRSVQARDVRKGVQTQLMGLEKGLVGQFHIRSCGEEASVVSLTQVSDSVRLQRNVRG